LWLRRYQTSGGDRKLTERRSVVELQPAL
jgi:hypothetical protein